MEIRCISCVEWANKWSVGHRNQIMLTKLRMEMVKIRTIYITFRSGNNPFGYHRHRMESMTFTHSMVRWHAMSFGFNNGDLYARIRITC